MKIWDKIVSLFDAAEEVPLRSTREVSEQKAAHVFNTYYRFQLALYAPTFLAEIKADAWALDVIEDLSKALGLPVPNNTDIALDPLVYQRIQQVLVSISEKPPQTACGI